MKRLTVLGVGLTALYVVPFGIGVWVNWSKAVLMSLNEWGDFLAGVSAPVALLWLVVGYFQHGQELRLNTEALRHQQEELKRQAEEAARLAKATEELVEETRFSAMTPFSG